ncbi:MAG: penicillin acylase family protein [Myxococcota bacterium]
MTSWRELHSRRGLLLAGAAGLLAALGLAWVAIELEMGAGGPPPSGSLELRGLDAPVEIVRDRHGIPHIRAGSLREAYLGLGFVHAQDRLWQMELLRRSASGRLSELFGRSTLEADRLARTLAIGAAASAEWTGVSRDAREVLTAYTKGVNRWVSELAKGRARLPLEFRWLGHEPERWRPEDALAVVRLRSWLIGRSLGASLLLDRLVREIGGVASSDFFPVRPTDGAHDTLATLLELGRRADTLARAVGLQGRVGSLGFVVSAARSASHAPLLANDPHVEFALPALFYLAHLDTPGLELSGATWPGVPVFWTGTNGTSAWGQVATQASVTELVRENLHPESRLRYDLNGSWLDVESRTERIEISGEDALELEVLSTRNGPLLDAVLPGDATARALALRWTGSGAKSGIEALLRLQLAGSWRPFRRALERYPGPVATFLYADAREIGRQVAGQLPIRAVQTSLLPVVGGSRYYDWRGFIPFEQLPTEHASGRPWLVASTHPEELAYGRRVIWLWSSPGGEARLRARLSEGPPLDLAQVLALQRERRSERGRRAVRELLDGVELRSAHALRLAAMLRSWDGDTSPGSRGALVYHVFRDQLTAELLRPRLGPRWSDAIAAAAEPLPGVVLERFLDRATSRATSALVELALQRAWRFLQAEVSANPSRWSWGKLHQLRLRHAFGQLGVDRLGWLGRRLAPSLGRGPYPVGGDPDSVWTMYRDGLLTSGDGVGPAFRYAIDLADAGHAQVGLAGGQSGHSGSEHYDDALREWLRGRPRTLWMHASDVTYHRVGAWELHPARD